MSPCIDIQRHRTQEGRNRKREYGHFSNFPQMTSISVCRPMYLQPRPGPNNIGSHSILFCKLSSRNVNIRSPSSMARSVSSLLVTVTTLGALVRTSLAVTCYSCSQVTSWRLTLPWVTRSLSGEWLGPGAGQRNVLRGSLRRVLPGDGLVRQDLARQHQRQHDRWREGLDCVWEGEGESPPDWLSLLLWDNSI